MSCAKNSNGSIVGVGLDCVVVRVSVVVGCNFEVLRTYAVDVRTFVLMAALLTDVFFICVVMVEAAIT